jgi:quercetin dioxygenase-like cupin family protein
MAKTKAKAPKAKTKVTAGAKAAPKKPAARRTAAKKATPAAKKPTPAAKKAKPAAKKAAPAAKPAAKRASTRPADYKARSIDPRKRHAFLIQHFEGDGDFKNDGFRPYAWYRDLGLAKATNGMAQAHIIRMVPPCTDEVRQRHFHVTQLQYAYILRGWMKLEVEGRGPMVAKEGTFFMLPQNIRHTVLDYSDDCEMMEVIMPADYQTVSVPPVA